MSSSLYYVFDLTDDLFYSCYCEGGEPYGSPVAATASPTRSPTMQPTPSPTQSPTQTPVSTPSDGSVCSDIAGWADSYGDGCEWYETYDQPGCPSYGGFWANPTTGITPGEAW